jgi:hypothetical protein
LGGPLTPAAKMAMNDDSLIAPRGDLQNPSGEFSHRHEHGSIDMRNRVFIRIATIDEQKIVACVNRIVHRAAIDIEGQRRHVHAQPRRRREKIL